MYFSFKATEGQPISLAEVTNRPVNLPKQQRLLTNHIPCLQEVRPIIFLFFQGYGGPANQFGGGYQQAGQPAQATSFSNQAFNQQSVSSVCLYH